MASNSNRRISRTDMDFEQALRSEGTVKLADSVDVNTLGADISPGPTARDFALPKAPSKENRTHRPQPATPVVVPPTPSPATGPSSTKMPDPSPSSSGDIFYDAEDGDIQTKRRSLYRSPGTSSSPDLATLLRKAKERGGTVGVHHKKLEKRNVPPPPLPTAAMLAPERSSTSTGTRPRSSTSSATFSPGTASSSSIHTVRGKEAGGSQVVSSGNNDWVFASPRSRKVSKDDGVRTRHHLHNSITQNNQQPKKSVRAKTSAFLGKMWGQGTVRDRSVS